jgi:hypothetical protein
MIHIEPLWKRSAEPHINTMSRAFVKEDTDPRSRMCRRWHGSCLEKQLVTTCAPEPMRPRYAASFSKPNEAAEAKQKGRWKYIQRPPGSKFFRAETTPAPVRGVKGHAEFGVNGNVQFRRRNRETVAPQPQSP